MVDFGEVRLQAAEMVVVGVNGAGELIDIDTLGPRRSGEGDNQRPTEHPTNAAAIQLWFPLVDFSAMRSRTRSNDGGVSRWRFWASLREVS